MSDTTLPSAAGQPPTAPVVHGLWWRTAIPILVAVVLALMSPPAGLPQHAWYYFAIFAGIVAALVLEPLPNAAVGVLGITIVAVLAQLVLESPADLARPGFSVPADAVSWAFSGFASSTVWLVGGAFMFAMAYQKTGLGRRIALWLVKSLGKNTLTLGYASTAAETVMALFTPSNTARGAGTIFPIVNNIPPLYDSRPNDPSSRRIGSYVLYSAFAANTITSSLFVTGCAPNFLAISFAKRIAKVDISWGDWLAASAPFAVPLLLLTPIIIFFIYPPGIRRSTEVSDWAAGQLREMGAITGKEILLGLIVIGAVLLWVFGDKWMDAAIAAFLAVSLMLVFGVFTWNDMARNHAAWTTVTLLATLVTMAGGLARVGFIKWFADYVAKHIGGFDATTMVMMMVTIYFLSHYMFASLTAHTSAMFPIMLGVGMGVPGVPADKLALALALTTGIMGILTPYATGSALPYYNSGYIRPAAFWGLGAVLGLIFLAALLFIGVPVMMMH